MLVARYAQRDVAYLGMIGSESKRRILMSELAVGGVDPQRLARVETPIGLPIGGKSPGEVALSILARVVQVKNELERAAATDVSRVEQVGR
jgi:xanthine dehydrogenase accessory factor